MESCQPIKRLKDKKKKKKKTKLKKKQRKNADPGGRAFYGVGLRPLTASDCGFEFRWGHGCLSDVSVVYCHEEVFTSG
jgi:hypothetical protein